MFRRYFYQTMLLIGILFIYCQDNSNLITSNKNNDDKESFHELEDYAIQKTATKSFWFSGYEWETHSGYGGPGPNNWIDNNVWLDSNGYLHLKISKDPKNINKWYCAEVSTKKSFGFGKYQFYVIGRIDKYDPNIVLGLFNYPTPNVGPDGTNEIDIEFAKWGKSSNPNGNYTVWPTKLGLTNNTKTFSFSLNGDYTTQRFTWDIKQIYFQSLNGHRNDNKYQFGSWTFKPKEYSKYIPQNSIPVHINLWLFNGQKPSNKNEVEVIIKSFKFSK